MAFGTALSFGYHQGGLMKLTDALRKVGRDAFVRGYLWRYAEEQAQLKELAPSWFNAKELTREFDALVAAELKNKGKRNGK